MRGGTPVEGTMRAVAKLKPGQGCSLIDAPIPGIRRGEVLVKVKAAAICGTDVHIYEWDEWSQKRIKTPLIFGHEFCGDVVEVGDGVTSLKKGQFVSIETHINCGHCFYCRQGMGHICETMQIIGVDRNGCFAEYVAVPETACWTWDISVSAEIAAVQDPYGNAVHTALAQDLVGADVFITGMGPIGLAAIPVAKLSGAKTVFVTDVSEYRLDLARKLGADFAINPKEKDPVALIRQMTGGRGADVLLEMSGNPAAIKQGFAALRKAGKAALLGIPSKPVEFDMANDIIFKSIEVRGINGRRIWDTWYKGQALLAKGLDLSKLITHRMPLEDIEKGLELMIAGECGKVILYP